MEKDMAKKDVLLIPFSDKYERLDSPPAAKKVKLSRKTHPDPCDGIYIRFEMKGDSTGSPDYLRVCKPDKEEESSIFWKLLSDAKFACDGPSALDWSILSIEAPFKVVPDKSDKGAVAKSAAQSTLLLTFPVLTNKDELKARSKLTVPRGAAPSVF